MSFHHRLELLLEFQLLHRLELFHHQLEELSLESFHRPEPAPTHLEELPELLHRQELSLESFHHQELLEFQLLHHRRRQKLLELFLRLQELLFHRLEELYR